MILVPFESLQITFFNSYIVYLPKDVSIPNIFLPKNIFPPPQYFQEISEIKELKRFAFGTEFDIILLNPNITFGFKLKCQRAHPYSKMSMRGAE